MTARHLVICSMAIQTGFHPIAYKKDLALASEILGLVWGFNDYLAKRVPYLKLFHFPKKQKD